MMKQWAVFGSLSLSWLVAACADADTLEQAQQAIIGGSPTQGDPAVTVLMAFKAGEAAGGLCTATLISPTVLLTAAHCVDPSVVGEGMQFEARFYHDVREAPTETRIPVLRVDWDRAFNKDDLPAGHDIGVAILERPAPGIAPLPYLLRPIEPSMVGQTVRLVGFGLDNGFDNEGSSAGIKRETSVPLTAIGEQLLEVGSFGNTFCVGDTGGPGLMKIDGVETIVGINSYGFVFCLGSGYQTRVDRYTDFLDRFVDDSTCVPSCDGRSCGSDGCRGSCGGCPAGESCTAAGVCQSPEPPPDQGCPSETENNDDAPNANALCDGDLVHGTIGQRGDEDWFVTTIDRSTTYTFLLDNITESTSFTVYERQKGVNGNLMRVGDGVLAGSNKVLSGRTQTGGTYFVRVYGYSSSQVYGLYSIKFE